MIFKVPSTVFFNDLFGYSRVYALKLPTFRVRWLFFGLRLGVLIGCVGLAGCGSGTAVSPSPFISFVHLDDFDLSGVTGVQYTVASKPGSVSKPVHVEYSISALAARGYVLRGSLAVPVFGLYAGYDNQVSVQIEEETGGPISFEFTIPTPHTWTHPAFIVNRTL